MGQVPLSAVKKVVFTVIAFVVLPLLLLASVEAALRISGYGFPTSFLRPMEIGGEQYLVENDKFGLRFFPPELARSPPPIVIPAKKNPGTCRIFVIGESAALGDPRPAFGPGRQLEALLEQRYPGSDFEVVLAAMTAINSHALLPIVKECARYEPDAWVIYMGNNEMVGPFGAASVFGARAPSASYARLNMALQRLRLGQWVMATGRQWAGRSSGEVAWGGMKMFLDNKIAPADPRKQVVYKNFSKNLAHILRETAKSGAPTLLNTIAVNLRDCAPFAPADDDAGASATTQFALGRKLLSSPALTEWARARQLLENARDADALPFRADSRINAILADAARTHDVMFVDAAAVFAANAPANVPGREHFLEHVHFDFSGSYLLARAWATALDAALPQVRSRAGTPPGWASPEACAAWLGLTDWNRVTAYEEMVRRLGKAPFVNQANHAEQMAEARARVRETRLRLTPEAAAAARQVYTNALGRAPGDHRLHEVFAEFLEGTGELAEASAEWMRVRDLAPHHHAAWFHAGRLALRLGRLDEAQALLEKAVNLRPDLAEGWLELGQLHALAGRHEVALRHFERERRLVPSDHRAHYHIGKTFSRLNRREEAIASLQQALRIKPDFWEAHYAIGEEFAFAGRINEARQQFEQVVRLRPDYPMAHFNLGVALYQSGNRDAALQRFQETLRLDPRNSLASEYLVRLRK